MQAANFLPQSQIALNNLLLFGVLLLAGLLSGYLFHAALRLPRIVGFVAVGMLLGPSGLNWLTEPTLEDAQVFVDIGLGLVLYELGNRLDLKWFARNRWLLASGIAESALAFLCVYLALYSLSVQPLLAALLASLAVSTSPAVLTYITRELKAEGQVTERALNYTALNNVVAFFGVAMLLPALHLEHRAGVMMVALHPLYLLLGSVLLGLTLSAVGIKLAALIGKRDGYHFILIVSLVVIAVGAAEALRFSVLLTVLTLGILTRNLDQNRSLMPVEFGRGGELFIIVLFVVSGARLRFGANLDVAWIGATIVIARFVGKWIGLSLFARTGPLGLAGGWNLTLVMQPLTGAVLISTLGLTGNYPEVGASLSAGLMLALAVLELLGPIAVQWGLKRAGETHN